MLPHLIASFGSGVDAGLAMVSQEGVDGSQKILLIGAGEWKQVCALAQGQICGKCHLQSVSEVLAHEDIALHLRTDVLLWLS